MTALVDKAILSLAKLALNSKLRGSSRFVHLLAGRFSILQKVPASIPSGTLFLDLRVDTTHSLFLNPTKTEPELELVKKLVGKNDTVYDIGSHVGLYTIHLSDLVGKEGRVYAFEPNRAVLPALKKTIAKLDNVKLFELGLSDKKNKAILAVPENNSMASLKDWTKGENGKVSFLECEIDYLDGLAETAGVSKPDFIKCDIEGGEYDCFRGGKNLLNQFDAPIILFEANINATRGYGIPISQAMDFLASLDKPQYSFFLINQDESLKLITEVNAAHANILAFPKSKMSKLSALRTV